MISTVAERSAELESLCQRYGVLRLELFGSAVTGDYRHAGSDLDFLVEFKKPPFGGYAHAYFGLLKSLEQLFERPVDLVVESAIRNPYFRESVDESRVLVYAA